MVKGKRSDGEEEEKDRKREGKRKERGRMTNKTTSSYYIITRLKFDIYNHDDLQDLDNIRKRNPSEENERWEEG